jgi:hypothetical protein
MTTIKLKNGSGAPTSGDLVQGEPALDLTNKRLYTEDSGGTVIEVGTNPTSITTGTVTADGLTVNGTPVRFVSTAPMLNFMESGVTDNNHRLRQNFGNFVIQKLSDDEGTATDRIAIDGGTGDISFYNAAGTSQSLYWDASAESLGLGTSSPSNDLHISSTSGTKALFEKTGSTGAYIGLKDSSGSLVYLGDNNGTFEVQTAGSSYSTKLAVTSAGNVGINKTSPAYKLDLNGDMRFSSGSALFWGDTNVYEGRTGNDRYWVTGATERMRITSAGNLLHGITGVPTGVLLGKQLVSSSPTGSEIIAFREDSSVAVGDKCGALLIGNSDPDGAEDHFVGMWGKASSTNGSQDLHFAAGRSGYEGDSPQMTLSSGGNVGINTTSPDEKLDVENGNIRLKSNSDGNTGLFRLYDSAGVESGQIYPANGDLNFYSPNDVIFSPTGKVGIGTSNPDAPLQVQTSHTSTDVTAANSNSTLNLGNSGSGNGVYNSIKFAGNQQDMYIMSFNNTAQANRRIGFFLGSVSGDATTDERLSITGSGNVGINTSSPSFPLDISGERARIAGGTSTTFAGLEVENSNGHGTVFGTGGSARTDLLDNRGYVTAQSATDGLAIGTEGADPVIFYTSGTTSEACRIDSSQNLLVGTTAVGVGTARHNVYNDTTNIASILVNQSGTANSTPVQRFYHYEANSTTSATMIQFLNRSVGQVGNITSTGSATSYNTSSDQRLKDNIVDAPSASDDIDAIQVRSFDWKADGSHQKYGMVAQELQSVAPEAVTGDADSDDMMGVDYSKLVPMLVKEIQSLRARVAQLETN